MAYRFNSATANPGGLYLENVFSTLTGPPQDSSGYQQPVRPSQDNSIHRPPAELYPGNQNGLLAAPYFDPHLFSSFNPPAVPSPGPSPGPPYNSLYPTFPPGQIEAMACQFAMPGVPTLTPPAYHYTPTNAPAYHHFSNNTRREQQEYQQFTGFNRVSGGPEVDRSKAELMKQAQRNDLYPNEWMSSLKIIMVLQSQVKAGFIRNVPVVPEIRDQTLERLQELRSASKEEIINFNAAIEKIVADAEAAHAAAAAFATKGGSSTTLLKASSTAQHANSSVFAHQGAEREEAARRYEAERLKNAMPGNQIKRAPHMRARIKNERLFTLTDKKRTLSDGNTQCESY